MKNIPNAVPGEAKYLCHHWQDPSLSLRMTWALRVTWLLVMAVSLLFSTQPARAQSGVELANVAASIQYGEQVVFLAEIRASIPIQQASIVIMDDTQGITRVQPIEVNPEGRTEYRFDTRQNLVRPFSTLRWKYQFALGDGTTFESATYFIRYDDNRFAWQTLEAGTVKMHWYNGDTGFGEAALNAAQAGLQSISRVMPLDLTQPVDIFLYANADDLRATLAPGGEEWVAGHADPALGVVTAVIEPGAEQAIYLEQRIPHELMHVMLYRRVGAGYGNLPAWLLEGTATLAELYPNPDYDRVLAETGNRNGLIPLRDLCASFSPNVGEAFLAYAESRSFTNYLRDTYGAAGLLSLAGYYADGVDCERGPERAFGLPLSKLERDWRQSALGQNALGVTLRNTAPYLVLLCLVMFIPLAAILGTLRRKGDPHGPETYVEK